MQRAVFLLGRFNFRVAQYLAKNGWFKFAKWFGTQLESG